ncbi:MFS domain-containing protein [Fusarium keratoplasticum]|uniref:MFS domain-containing protein n=1 Tax=Fusarium keratoplasticum TaxID=1328300 RepID=A0ACC0RDF3_9HYPO|nr:MFS domain-containing protein [Fusarium keratoplasticum]KAI8683363.1 MFS domain-containing protein [Fusarium keratoplasticum]
MSTTSETTLSQPVVDGAPNPPRLHDESVTSEIGDSSRTASQLRDALGASTSPSEEKPTDVRDLHVYPSGLSLALICLGLGLAVFCLGLDRSILATAIPKITNDFDSLNDVAWYGSSYLLTTCCFQLMFGKLYVEFKTTWIFLLALALFELGSLVCAVAPSSIALIIGRSIAGIGCAGLLSGALIILANSVPLHKRPIYTGLIGAVSGIAQIIAPTLGGVFTDHATWRWCFWINLPLGAVTAAVVVFVKFPIKTQRRHITGVRVFVHAIDLLGTVVFMPCIICLLLALQWGGTTYAWSNWRIIMCLCFFAVLGFTWGCIQYRRGDDGTLPSRLLKQRSVVSGMLFTLGISGSLFIVTYYVPIWFQSVKNTTAEQSGVNFLTATGGMSLAAVLGGIAASRIGYYVPQMILSSIVSSIAAGLIYRYSLNTTTGYWVGTLILFGVGAGLGLQMPLTAVQTVLKGADISLGTSAIVLVQTISGTIFLAVGQNVFQAKLLEELSITAPEVDPRLVVSNGVSGLVVLITETYGAAVAKEVLEAYNAALRRCFMVCVILAPLTILGAVGMEWKNVRQGKHASEDSRQEEVGLAKMPSAT